MNEAMREKLIDDARDAERDDIWTDIKNGLHLYDEWAVYLDTLDKDVLIAMLLDSDYDYIHDEYFDEWLHEFYM